MSNEPPSPPKSPTETEPSGFRWRRDEEDDDLLHEELPFDSEEDFEEALERALARDDLDSPFHNRRGGTSSSMIPGPSNAGEDEVIDHLPRRRSLADVEQLALRLAQENATLTPGRTEETPDPSEGAPRATSPVRWRALAGGLLGILGGVIALVALFSAWRLSLRVDQLAARLAVGAVPVQGNPKAPTNGGGQAQGATLYGRHEELRSQIEQLRSQVIGDTLRLQGELRELTMRSEQRWQALEAGSRETQRSPARAMVAPASQPIPNGTPSPSPVSPPKPATPPGGKMASTKSSSGTWSIIVGSLGDPTLAAQEVSRLHDLGVVAKAQVVQAGGKAWHRILVGDFPTREAAEAFVSKAKANPKLKRIFADSWIGRR